MAELPFFKEVTPIGVTEKKIPGQSRREISVILAVTEASYDEESGECRFAQSVCNRRTEVEVNVPVPLEAAPPAPLIAEAQTVDEARQVASERHKQWVDRAQRSSEEGYEAYYYL